MPDVDIVRRAWAAWEAREMDRVDELFDPGIVFDFSHYGGWPHRRLYTGVPSTMQALGEWMLWWHAYWQDLLGYEEHPGCVLALVRHGGDRDGGHVEEQVALLFYVHNGLITRWEPWADVEAARALMVVRRAWAAWQERDMDAVVECMTPGVIHDLSHFEGWPGEPVHAGVGPALHSLAEWMAWWKAYRQDLVGYESDGGRVLIVARHVGARDGERVEEDLGLLMFVSDGRIVRWEPWSDLEAARAALRRA